jgi:mannitol-1-phosphate/altronate dehydrogenase
MVQAGKQSDEIRQVLRRVGQLQQYSAEDSPILADQKTICNRVEERLNRIWQKGVEDAVEGRTANYQSPPGY